ncbi:MAG: hypothetical protein S4CHLAM81_09150 [Chlamydiales bacterium]|nr:hypothetical protein [Chlamydiales bacterium]MCH9635694.1 hypothetical protein [Chlamydiales bacterium]
MLKEIQEFLGHAISSKEMDIDADGIVTAGPVLTANERLGIYHDQYWLRLLDVLKTSFPTLEKELGDQFDHNVGIPFLQEYPPDTWALCRIGEKLPSWLNDPHLSTIAALDWAAEIAFWEKNEKIPDFSTWNREELFKKKLYLQPSITLFDLEADYFAYREEKELEKRRCFFVVYRSPKGLASWREICKTQYELLTSFQKGCSIEAACDEIEAGEEIALWFKEWTSWHFFSESSSHLS